MSLPDTRSHALAAAAPWLATARARIASAIAERRLPHALLIRGQQGLGKAALADFIARFALCDRPGSGPCGACPSCVLHEAGTHPDLRRVGLVEEKKQIAVDDIRDMITALTLKSYRGGRKVAIIDPADALNPYGANALLKTLEEPSAGALLILTVARPERLPATVASRCQRIAVLRPDAERALAWLKALDAEIQWPGLLALAAGAPVAAVELARAGAIDLEKEMSEVPSLLAKPSTDLVALAEHCQKRLPAERLRWMENWVTDRIRRGLLTASPGHSPGNPGLPSAARTRHIQGLYAILDQLRVAQAALRGPANVTMLWEQVLGMLARELMTARADRTR
ncbi:MAG TPA: DNA polymerase III subunit [Steroidobacteraceae bacterium]|nr:DNA polymerase III subunit [Steroidobacteraceae bacterium]